jgi:hypothetical protein
MARSQTRYMALSALIILLYTVLSTVHFDDCNGDDNHEHNWLLTWPNKFKIDGDYAPPLPADCAVLRRDMPDPRKALPAMAKPVMVSC